MMPGFQVATLALSIMLVVLANNIIPPLITDGAPDTSVVDWDCSQQDEWAENDPYGKNVADTLDVLIWSTPGAEDSQLDWVGTYKGTTVYAEAGCEQHLDGKECFDCLIEADIALDDLCHHNINGSMQMMDCGMRYSNQKLDW